MTSMPTFDSTMNSGQSQPKEMAPGAKAGRICGILAIVLALTCVGIPIAIILGIVAIVKTSKARSLARSYPDTYEIPSSAGLILGIVGLCLPIVMLPVAGIVSAIAIPALLSQRARARDKAAISNMVGRFGDLVSQYDQLAETKQSPEEIRGRLEAYLKTSTAQDKNPWDIAQPAYRWTITEGGATKEDTELVAREKAMAVGQVIFVFTAPVRGRSGFVGGGLPYAVPAPDDAPDAPAQGHPGFIGGAVKVQNMVNGENIVTKVVQVE